MPDYRRNWVPGGTFFFTVVTAGRAPIFRDVKAVTLLGSCLRHERRERRFRIEAIVVLPDHFHTIWSLPEGDSDFATRWAAIKGRFTRQWLASGMPEQPVHPGQGREQRRGVWQPRFMEHTIRDEDDFIHHIEYIHFNPVKHGHVPCPAIGLGPPSTATSGSVAFPKIGPVLKSRRSRPSTASTPT
ncbi:MAG TPA: transposase [Isosphaeraceae bacterium]|jgi:putative transposase|nr:transposase [Isosphaeraceae bacterium]